MKKTRYLDHIDLRVSDLKRAHKFYGKLLPAQEKPSARADDGEFSMRLAETSRMRSSASRKIDVISPMARDSLFGLRPVKKWIGWPGSCARSAENAWKVRRSVAPTAAAIMPAFLKIRMETKWRFVAGKVRLSRVSGLHSPGSALLLAE